MMRQPTPMPMSPAALVTRFVAVGVLLGVLAAVVEDTVVHYRASRMSRSSADRRMHEAMEAVHPQLQRWRDVARCRTKAADGFPALETFFTDGPRPVVVLLWDAHEFSGFLYPNVTDIESCPVPCAFVRSLALSCLDEADAVLLHGPALAQDQPLPVHRALHQLRVLFSTEANANWRTPRSVAFRQRHFDLRMTYERDSEVRLTYFLDAARYLRATPHVLRPLVRAKAADNRSDSDAGEAVASLMVSNCSPRSPRNALVAELLQWLPVASAGRCFPSAAHRLPSGALDKVDFMAHFPFHIAIENAFETDYVTEKFFDCFRAGVVCIYMGAPNVDDFAPGPNSFIDIRRYDSMEALARDVMRIAGDAALYAQLHAWRAQPSTAFLPLQRFTPDTAPCRLCQAVAALRLEAQQQRQHQFE